MLRFAASPSSLSDSNAFSAAGVLNGVRATAARCEQHAGRVWVEVDGAGDCLRFYGASPGNAAGNPIIFLEGDVLQPGGWQRGRRWQVSSQYRRISPASMQSEAARTAAAAARTFVNLARPGTYGSSGNHLHRRREREVALVDRAVSRLTQGFGWSRIDLAGLSGGGHLVAALLGRRADVDHAVIASGNVAVRERLRERGLEIDVTGFADFVDPTASVRDVARHPPRRLTVLTDPLDEMVSASSQRAYVEALRAAGVDVEHRLASAPDPGHHIFPLPAILAPLLYPG